VTELLAAKLAAGCEAIGEVMIRSTITGFVLHHREDLERGDLTQFTEEGDARELAKLDDRGHFRPLKSAPNLRHGWRMQVPDLPALRRVLDMFYPAMLGVLLSHKRGELEPVLLRTTLGRQTGMYAVTKRITDAQANETIAAVCTSRGGCLKTILWHIAPNVQITSLPAEKSDPSANQLGTPERAIPLLCHEGCNFLVAKIREVVKAS
jgi:sirohydrochlorin cobaltochelatase